MDFYKQFKEKLGSITNPRDKARFAQSEYRYLFSNWPCDGDEIVGHMAKQEYVSRSAAVAGNGVVVLP